jgi:GT2 family glycosyltransferase
MQDWPHDEVRPVDWVSGAAMFVSKDVLDRVGFMDPAFFMYCEDVDWCWRARAAGFEVVYLPSAVVTHEIGRSTDQAANRMILRFHRSMLYFYKKNMLPSRPLPIRPFLYLGAAAALTLRGAMFIAKNKWDVLRRKLSR